MEVLDVIFSFKSCWRKNNYGKKKNSVILKSLLKFTRNKLLETGHPLVRVVIIITIIIMTTTTTTMMMVIIACESLSWRLAVSVEGGVCITKRNQTLGVRWVGEWRQPRRRRENNNNIIIIIIMITTTTVVIADHQLRPVISAGPASGRAPYRIWDPVRQLNRLKKKKKTSPLRPNIDTTKNGERRRSR